VPKRALDQVDGMLPTPSGAVLVVPVEDFSRRFEAMAR